MNCPNCGKTLRADQKFCPACGTPVAGHASQTPPLAHEQTAGGPAVAPPAPYTPPPAQVRTSWGPGPAAAPPRKSRAGKILLVVFGLFLLLAVGAGVAVYYGVRHFASSVKSSEPYRVAEKELRENPAAREALGEIKSTGFPLGSTFGEEADGTGHAAYTMSVEGTRASGQYVAMLKRVGGVWQVVNADLQLSDGRAIRLVGGSEGGGEAVPTGGPPRPPAPVISDEPVSVPGAAEAGALDQKALSRPEPAYPSIARAARATGKVVVRVTVDESGQVIMASATSGHPLLRPAAVAAARQARFAPTIKGGQPVKVVGTLTYEFR